MEGVYWVREEHIWNGLLGAKECCLPAHFPILVCYRRALANFSVAQEKMEQV